MACIQTKRLFLGLVVILFAAAPLLAKNFQNPDGTKAAGSQTVGQPSLARTQAGNDGNEAEYFILPGQDRPPVLERNELKKAYATSGIYRVKLTRQRAAELSRKTRLEPAGKLYEALLEESGPLVGESIAWAGGFMGNGSKVCVIDTGIDFFSLELPAPAQSRDFTAQDWCIDGPRPVVSRSNSFNYSLNISNASITWLNTGLWWVNFNNRFDYSVFWPNGTLLNTTTPITAPTNLSGFWFYLNLTGVLPGVYTIQISEASINVSNDDSYPTLFWGENLSQHAGYFSGLNGKCISTPNPLTAGLPRAFANVHAQDDNGHGSHVAGVVARKGITNSSIRGIAFNATLLVAKALNSDGYGLDSEIVDAMQWCIDSGANVMSMSLGGTVTAQCNDAMDLMADAALAQGVLPVIAAGNSGPAASSVASPGCARGALTVGAAYKANYSTALVYSACTDSSPRVDQIACFSSRGPLADKRLKPEIVAPGAMINSSYITNATKSLAGTSMAAPHVAAAAAILRQMHPAWSALQLKAALIESASTSNQSLTLPDNSYGFGRLNMTQFSNGLDAINLSWNTSQNYSFRFYSNSTGPLSIAAVWAENSSQAHAGTNFTLVAANGSAYFSDNSSWLVHRITLPASQAGNWTVSISAYVPDNTSRQLAISAAYDIFSPRITAVSIANGSVFNSSSKNVTVTADYNSSPLSMLWYSLDGVASVPANASLQNSVTLTGLTAGLHNITFFANDTLGRSNSTGVIFFNASLSIPTVTLFSPLNGTVGNSTFNVSFAANDSESAINMTWYEAGGAFGGFLLSNGTVAILGDGVKNLSVYSNNSNSNAGLAWVMVVNDLTGPNLSAQSSNFSSAVFYAGSPAGLYQFHSSWTDWSNVSRVYFELDGANYSASNASQSNFSYSPNLSLGSHSYRWHAYDFFNQTASTNSSEVLVAYNASAGLSNTVLNFSNGSSGAARLDLLLANSTVLSIVAGGNNASVTVANISAYSTQNPPNQTNFFEGYEINVTANATLSICFNYSSFLNSTINESSVAAYRYFADNQSWANVTTLLSSANKSVCGNVSSAQTPYIAAGRNVDPAPTPSPTPAPAPPSGGSSGSSGWSAVQEFGIVRAQTPAPPSPTPALVVSPTPVKTKSPLELSKEKAEKEINYTRTLLAKTRVTDAEAAGQAEWFASRAEELYSQGRYEEAYRAALAAQKSIEELAVRTKASDAKTGYGIAASAASSGGTGGAGTKIAGYATWNGVKEILTAFGAIALAFGAALFALKKIGQKKEPRDDTEDE